MVRLLARVERGWCRDGRYAGAGGTVAKHARPTGRSALCWPHGSPDESGRKRGRKGLTRSGNARVRRGTIQLAVAISHVPGRTAPWRSGFGPAPRRLWHSQDHDRGLGAQATGSPCGGSCGRAWCRTASFCGRHNERRILKDTQQFRPGPSTGDGSPMTVRGGGVLTCFLGFQCRKGRMGPPLRSFAADAHDCIMVRALGPTGYKAVARLIAPAGGLPL